MKSSKDKIYFSNVGLQPIVIVNGLWAYSNSYGCPSHVYLFPTNHTYKYVKILENTLRVFCPDIVLEYNIVDEVDILSMIASFTSKIIEYKNRNFMTIVDITAGRKTMSVALYSAALKAKSDIVMYLHLKDNSYMGIFYPMIPKPLIDLVILYGKA